MVVMTVFMRMPVSGAVAANAADMVVMAGLRRTELAGVTDDLRAIFAELAVHRRIAAANFLDALGEGIEHERMVAQIRRLHEIDRGKASGDCVGLLVDALHQDPGEEEIRK